MEQRRLRIGVTGLGRVFSLMLPTFLQDPRVQLVAACDPREEAQQQLAADFGARTYADVRDLVGDPDVEVIYVASSHQFHAQHTGIAAVNGEYILVGKPMTFKAADCDRMIAACWAANVHLIVGHRHSFGTPYLRMRDLIRSGDFGVVKMIQTFNYTNYLHRPRCSEELMTVEGGGAVFNQAAHQVDIVRMLAGSRATRLRTSVGRQDPKRPTEGAYSALIWLGNGAYASLSYSGYGHFNSDEWMSWIGEMGDQASPDAYGAARRRLATIASSNDETQLKAAGTYGGATYKSPSTTAVEAARHRQYFGPVIVACGHAGLRPLPDSIIVYGDHQRETLPLSLPTVPRGKVIDELYEAIIAGRAPLHNGEWAKDTLEICIAILESSETDKDVSLWPS